MCMTGQREARPTRPPIEAENVEQPNDISRERPLIERRRRPRSGLAARAVLGG